MGNAAARVVSLLLVAGVALGAPPPASAAPKLPTDPTGDARARAHQLRVELAQLQTETEQATEDYDSAQSQLGQIVSAHILAEQQLQNAQNTVAGEGDAHAATIRALYRTGGPSALYATVFD